MSALNLVLHDQSGINTSGFVVRACVALNKQKVVYAEPEKTNKIVMYLSSVVWVLMWVNIGCYSSTIVFFFFSTTQHWKVLFNFCNDDPDRMRLVTLVHLSVWPKSWFWAKHLKFNEQNSFNLLSMFPPRWIFTFLVSFWAYFVPQQYAPNCFTSESPPVYLQYHEIFRIMLLREEDVTLSHLGHFFSWATLRWKLCTHNILWSN